MCVRYARFIVHTHQLTARWPYYIKLWPSTRAAQPHPYPDPWLASYQCSAVHAPCCRRGLVHGPYSLKSDVIQPHNRVFIANLSTRILLAKCESYIKVRPQRKMSPSQHSHRNPFIFQVLLFLCLKISVRGRWAASSKMYHDK